MEDVERVAYKLRATEKEFGREVLKHAVVVGPEEMRKKVAGFPYIRCKTLGDLTLGNVEWKVARFFEDA